MSELDIITGPPTRVHRLANGLTLVVREDRRAPVVAIVTRVAAGYFDESDEQVGISHVLEHMFFKGTPALGPGEIGRATRQAGGYLNASTIYNRTLYYTVLPSESLEDGLALQSDALLNAAIDPGELERELRVIIEEAHRKLDNPAAVAGESLYALMFQRHRMRRWRIGVAEQLAGFTREDVHAFYRACYRGPNIVLSIAGDVETERVVELVEQYYGALDGAQPPRDRGPAEPEQSGFRYRRIDGDITTAYIEWGWPTGGMLHPDTPALDMLAIALGQGRASRLYYAVRDAGHAQMVDAHHYTPEELGIFNVSIETTPDRITAALLATAQEIRQARGFTNDELERVRNLVRARLLRRVETVEGQANLLADWQALGDWRMAAAHYQRMLGVTPADLTDVAERYLRPERTSLLVHAPQDAHAVTTTEEMRALLFDATGQRVPATNGAAAADEPRQPAAHPSAPVELEQVEDGVHFYRTRGGARIVVLPRPGAGLVSLAIAAAGGTCTEGADEAGVTAFAGRAALKGTRRFTAAALAERTESLGGGIAASVGPDEFSWTLSIPARHLNEGIALLAEAALHPTFPEDELERERAVTLALLEQVRDDMQRYPLSLCLTAAFPHHPYGFALDVQEDATRMLTRSRVVDWHAQLVHASAPWCFVVGDVAPDAAARACAAHLDDRPHVAPDHEPCASAAVWPASPARAAVHRPRAQTALALAFPGPRRNELDADALRLLGTAVGGLGGRLFEELRSRRSLAYTVYAAPVARLHGGAFLAYIATTPEREEEARDGLLEELGRLRVEPIAQEEVERARRYSIGARRIRRQTNAAHLADLRNALLIGRGLVELRDYEQRLAALDGEVLRAAAERWLNPARLVEGVVRGKGAEALAVDGQVVSSV